MMNLGPLLSIFIKVVTSEGAFHAITPKVSFAATLTRRNTLPHRRPYIKY